MVMIAEQAINATEASGWWQGGGNAADLRVMENSFMDRMSKSGFSFVDPEVLSGKVKLEVVGADPNAQQAREIGSLAGAEIVIVGRAIAKPLGTIALDNGTFYSAVANVSARAVETATGRDPRVGGVHRQGRQGVRADDRRAQRALRGRAPARRRSLRQDRQGLGGASSRGPAPSRWW